MRRRPTEGFEVWNATAMVSNITHPTPGVRALRLHQWRRTPVRQARPGLRNLPFGAKRSGTLASEQKQLRERRRQAHPQTSTKGGRKSQDRSHPPLQARHIQPTARPLATSPAVREGQNGLGGDSNTAGRFARSGVAEPSSRARQAGQDGASATRAHAHARHLPSPHPDADWAAMNGQGRWPDRRQAPGLPRAPRPAYPAPRPDAGGR